MQNYETKWIARDVGNRDIGGSLMTSLRKATEAVGKWASSGATIDVRYEELISAIRAIDGIKKVHSSGNGAGNQKELMVVGIRDASVYREISRLIVDYESESGKVVSYMYRKQSDVEKNG